MISRDYLTQEFIDLVRNYHSDAEMILNCCYLKILECHLERAGKQLYYIGIYHPQRIAVELKKYQDIFKQIAENMGLVEVVYINATQLIRDPLSTLKRHHPRFWLELHWIATQDY
ncbi:MAG: hypothetical protein HC835_07355 [Oscillatoriales cyanobacterium RM2_1_1]|nr:hypothetical protein [Oscillatoriales cyanobacterium SM2_3_0]NJO45454.1 hypothetical protein [Oscillatoriales cyanobacterium RM2_1_1]